MTKTSSLEWAGWGLGQQAIMTWTQALDPNLGFEADFRIVRKRMEGI